MTSEEVNSEYLANAAAMFPQVCDKPCVNVDAKTKAVHLCTRIYGLMTQEDVLCGTCQWSAPSEDRPDELTDEFGICSSLLDVGPDWWLDLYFNWYFVFAPEFVACSLRGDHSWVDEFLRTATRNRTIPRPPSHEDITDQLPKHEALQYYG